MSLKDIEKIGARQMETLQKKQNREISRLEDGHQHLKAELKKSHDLEIVDIEHDNIQRLSTESEKKEKVLGQMKTHLEETRKFTDRELKELKDFAAKIKKEENEKLSAERERLKGEHDLYLEDLNYRFSTEQKKISASGQEQLDQIKSARGEELTQTENYFQTKIKDQTGQFTERFQADGRVQKKMKDDQDRVYKNERLSTNVRQQREMAKMTGNHSKFIEVRDQEFRKGLKEQDKFFDQKYAVTLKNRNEELSRLEELNTKVLDKLKGNLSQTLKASVDRADDPFYSFTELEAKLQQFDDRVEIAVNIPEHAKSDVQLTIHGKEAIVNFNRRYDDARKEAGVTNKLHKVESFTTRLLTNHHLDPKSVKASYEDGVMTYTVKRS